MRIAFVVDQFPSPSETFVLGQIAWLVEAGHEVLIYADRPGSGVVHADVDRLHLDASTRYGRRFRGSRAERQFRQSAFLLRRVMSRDVEIGGLCRSVARGGTRALPAWTYPDVKDGVFDAIVAHFGPNGVKAMEMRRAGVFSGPIATVFHGYDMNQHRRSMRRGYRQLFQDGELFLPINEYFRRRLLNWGAPSGRTMVHHMGVQLDRFPLRSRPSNDDQLHLISIARLVPKKGLAFGIRAAAGLGRGVRYTIVGDGPERETLASLITRLDAADRIHLAGWKSQSETASLLQQAHVLLAPSVRAPDGDEEGIPLALMEAMATGMPVVSTFHSGIPELVEDGVSGFLVPEANTELLQSRIAWLRDHPTHWDWMGRAGRRMVESLYNAPKLHERFIDLLAGMSRTPAFSRSEALRGAS
jgi:colanic acid/amylovoran biosynthesis glycosyltransferase